MAELVNYVSSRCKVCDLLCLNDAIFCELCKSWYHAKCLKIPCRQLSIFSKSKLPFFCSFCVINILPFSKLNNFQFTQANPVVNFKPLANLNCFKCVKPINQYRQSVKCKLGNHHWHKSCANIKPTDKINFTNWSCSDCLPLPFITLDSTDFNEVLNVKIDLTKKHKRNLNINIINSIKTLNDSLNISISGTNIFNV